MFKNSLFLSKLENNLIQNQSYLLMLAVFNVTILMNYHEMIWKNPLVMGIVFSMVCFTFLNFKLWWASAVTIFISFCIFATSFPRLANHSNLEFFVEIFILGFLIIKWCRPKIYINPNLISFVFRVSVVTIYFYTGFHKLNIDFFTPEVSCVKGINEYAMRSFMGSDYTLSPSLSAFFQYATIFIEILLPLGLFWHKTRKYSAVLMLIFHYYLSLTVFADFSALAAFLVLGCCVNFETKTISETLKKGLKWYVFFALLSVFIKPFLMKFGFKIAQVAFLHGFIFNIGWLIFFYLFFKNRSEKRYVYDRKHTAILVSFVLLISIWSMKSYVGLGNSANLTMFSNLLTEKSRSNHLLIDTKNTKIFDFEEDNLLILKLHDTLKKEKLEGFKLPVIEFKYAAKRWANKYPDLKINATLVYQNDTIRIDDLKKTKFIETKWWYHYIFFRKIQPEGPNPCYW